MPYYDYQCSNCHAVTNVKATMSERAAGLTVACSECESTETQQVFKAMAIVGSAGSSPAQKEFKPPAGPCGSACGCYN